MKRKEVNAFNISFLDILAGALGAVILLFIIIPKVSIQDVQKLEQMEQLEVQMETLDSLLEFAKDAIPSEDYEALIEQSKKILATIEELNNEVSRLQGSLKKKTQENENLLIELRAAQDQVAALEQQIRNQTKMQERIASLENQLQKEQAENKALERQLSALKEELKKRPNPPKPKEEIASKETSPQTQPKQKPTPNASSAGMDSVQVISFNPPLAVMIEWDDPEMGVRLYMRDVSSNQWCFYQGKRRRTSFGRWERMNRITNKPHEAIIQDDELVPGTYEIYANILRPKSGASTEISGYAAINTSNGVKRVSFGNHTVQSDKPPMLKSSGNSLLGTLTVTEDDIQWQPN